MISRVVEGYALAGFGIWGKADEAGFVGRSKVYTAMEVGKPKNLSGVALQRERGETGATGGE